MVQLTEPTFLDLTGTSPTAVYVEPAIRIPKPKLKIKKARWHKGKLKYL